MAFLKMARMLHAMEAHEQQTERPLDSMQMIRRRFLTISSAMLLGACAGTATRESTGEYIDDTAITGKVKTALLQDKQVSGLNINVETFKGKVQLSGFAGTAEERARALKIASEVRGVKSVTNDIRLK
jgi:osmotically-inducible protein OsmY